jgi:hypothetical protein
MHGESRDFSTFTQIGIQIVQPLPPSDLDVKFSLPPDTAAFTGRHGEFDFITAAVLDAAVSGGVVAIHAIGGMPGVGKTALAVHVARLLQTGFRTGSYLSTGPRQELPPRRMLMAFVLAGRGNRQATTWVTCILSASARRS